MSTDPVKVAPQVAVDTGGWHTVAAITYTDVNTAIKAHASFPSSFAQAYSDKSASVQGTFGAWTVTQGGAGPDIAMALEITGGSVTMATSFPIAPCSATIQVRSQFLPQPGAPNTLELRLDPKPSVPTLPPVSVFDITPPQSNHMAQAALRDLLQDWLIANLQAFNHVFASVDLDADFTNEGVSWLKPSWHGYAVAEPQTAPTNDNCVFAVLCLIDDTKPPANLVHQVSPYAIPTGMRAGFLISPDKFLQHMMLPALPLMFQGIEDQKPETNFSFDGSGMCIRNTNALTFKKVTLEDGSTCSPIVDVGNFSVEVDATELTISSTDLHFEVSPGVTQHLNQSSRSSLSYNAAKQIIDLNIVSQLGDGHVTVSKGVALTSEILGWVSLGLAVVAGAGAVVAKVASRAVLVGTDVSVGSLETGAVLAEDAANFPKAFPASAMMGLIPGAAGTFRSVAQITTSVARYAMIGCMATGAMPAALSIIKGIAEEDYDSVPKITELVDGAIGKVVIWPKAVGDFQISSVQLNQALQFGLK